MGKKRKRENSSDEDMGTKRIKNGSISEEININNISIDGDAKFKAFLIKKPIGVSLDDLIALKWSNDEELLAKNKIKTESGSYRVSVAPKSKKQRMVHIPAIHERDDEDSKDIRAQGFIHGAITILPVEVKSKVLGGSIYEEGEEPAKDAQIHPALKKIKKVAVLELESRKERNKAYGATTKGDGSRKK